MNHIKEIVFYENDNFIITKDKWNFIVRKKPLPPPKHAYEGATYICNKNNLLWEVCDCRKFCKRDSSIAIEINKALARL